MLQSVEGNRNCFGLRTALRAYRADEGPEGSRLTGSHTVSWRLSGVEASSSQQAPASPGPSAGSPFSWLDLQPASTFVLLVGTGSCPQQQGGKNLRTRDTISSGARTLALTVLTTGPSQSDFPSVP